MLNLLLFASDLFIIDSIREFLFFLIVVIPPAGIVYAFLRDNIELN